VPNDIEPLALDTLEVGRTLITTLPALAVRALLEARILI
jgi:hypothetical protein